MLIQPTEKAARLIRVMSLNKMQTITIFPTEVKDTIEHEGISFSNCTFIEIYVDGVPFEKLEEFEDGGVVYWDELKKSTEGSGKYLIFTCYCGIPDDAGWDYINVEHKESKISWRFERNIDAKFIFSKIEYINEIKSCEETFDLEKYPLAINISGYPEY